MREDLPPPDLETFWVEYMGTPVVWTQEELARRAFEAGYDFAMWEQRA